MDETSPNYTKIMEYIDQNPAAVLSTVDKEGTPHGAVIYVCTASHGTLCFVTKNVTKKYSNITERPSVSLTFFDERSSSTLQVQGSAYIASDSKMVDYVLDKVKKMHAMQAEWLPPVSKIQDGDYAVVGIEIQHARLAEYQGIGISGATFTEL
jgi:general stress protein 26